MEVEQQRRGRIEFGADGFRPYPQAVQLACPPGVRPGTVVKVYATKDDHRYRPAKSLGPSRRRAGQPDSDKICTSHVERHNLSMRMQNRRITRLTNDSARNGRTTSGAGPVFAAYNFVRPHGTLTHDAEDGGRRRRR